LKEIFIRSVCRKR